MAKLPHEDNGNICVHRSDEDSFLLFSLHSMKDVRHTLRPCLLVGKFRHGSLPVAMQTTETPKSVKHKASLGMLLLESFHNNVKFL